MGEKKSTLGDLEMTMKGQIQCHSDALLLDAHATYAGVWGFSADSEVFLVP